MLDDLPREDGVHGPGTEAPPDVLRRRLHSTMGIWIKPHCLPPFFSAPVKERSIAGADLPHARARPERGDPPDAAGEDPEAGDHLGRWGGGVVGTELIGCQPGISRIDATGLTPEDVHCLRPRNGLLA